MRGRIYTALIAIAIASTTFLALPAQAETESHLGTNCNTISHYGGQDQRVCIHVNRHDTWLWRAGLLDFCAGANGASHIFLDYLVLERNGRTAEVYRNHNWVSICSGGPNNYATAWDKACPARPAWQAHARFQLRWRSGGTTPWLTIHSGRDRGVC